MRAVRPHGLRGGAVSHRRQPGPPFRRRRAWSSPTSGEEVDAMGVDPPARRQDRGGRHLRSGGRPPGLRGGAVQRRRHPGRPVRQIGRGPHRPRRRRLCRGRGPSARRHGSWWPATPASRAAQARGILPMTSPCCGTTATAAWTAGSARMAWSSPISAGRMRPTGCCLAARRQDPGRRPLRPAVQREPEEPSS